MRIAPKQRQELDFLRDTLETLDRIADRDGRPAFRALRDRLEGWAAKIAVIGQVKAGKSTFVNALLRQHDFLPSDVNPWTSVVTNLRINMASDPLTGAKFEFFCEQDWSEIISGGSRIRELTEQLLPGFDTEQLRRQSEEMRERAQKRLGKHYHTLLGSSHDYDFLTPDLLKRYVCAGPGSDDGLERESLGRYAALTKVANVYLRMPEFLVPTIITDTPGVNDPFLVRDEFTCRSLDKSDVFVVVLSAHQPLTDVDLALIRILAKQDNKDVVIFVNRIDELDDYATEVPRVMGDVTRRLREAIPDIEFRICAGSAYMADLVLREDEEAAATRAAMDTSELADYIAHRYGRVPEDQDARLMLASGLDTLRATLSRVIDEGNGGRFFSQLAEDIRAEISGAQFAAKRERRSIQLQVECINSEVARDAVAQLQAELDEIQGIHDALIQTIESTETQIEKVVDKSWAKLQTQLIEGIDAFVEEQKAVLQERLFSDNIRGGTDKALKIDIGALQARMEAIVHEGFGKSRAAIDVTLNNCLHACRQKIQDALGDPTEGITLDDLPYEEFTSTLTLSRRTLNLELITDRGWQFWRRPSVNLEKSLLALRAIAAAELRPSVDKILAAFNEAQVDRAAAGTGRIRVILRMIDAGLSERTTRLRQDRDEMQRMAEDVNLQRRLVERLQSQMEVLERRLINFAAIDSAMSRATLSKAA